MIKVTPSTINEAFNDKGLNAIKTFYAKRNELNKDAKKTVVDIVERMAFKDCSMDAELAMELINKY